MPVVDFKDFLSKLLQNLNILREREAKCAGNAPLDLLNRIEDHQRAIALTEKAIEGQLNEAEWRAALKPLLVEVEVGTGVPTMDLMQLIKDLMDIGGHLERLAQSLESVYDTFIRIHNKRVERQELRYLQRQLRNIQLMILSRFMIIETLEHFVELVEQGSTEKQREQEWNYLRNEVEVGAFLIEELKGFLWNHLVPDPDPFELLKLMTATMRLYEQLPLDPPTTRSDLDQLQEIAESLRLILDSLQRIAQSR